MFVSVSVSLTLATAADPARLSATFPSCSHAADDLRRACTFWEAVMKMVAPLRAGGAMSDEQAAEFEAANAFLAVKRKALNP